MSWKCSNYLSPSVLLILFLFLYYLKVYRGPIQLKKSNSVPCNLDSLTKGAWSNVSQPRVPTGYKYCAVDTKQDCRKYATEYLYQEFIPFDKHCTIKNLHIDEIHQCLQNRQIIFVGDSLARNQFHSLQCMALDRPEEHGLVSVTGYKDNRDLHLSEYNASIRYIKNRHLVNISQLAAEVHERDIVVVGTGPWWRPELVPDAPILSAIKTWQDFSGGIAEAQAFLEKRVQGILRDIEKLFPATSLIFYRTPDLNHFYRGEWNATTANCAPYASSWNPASRQSPHEDVVWWLQEIVRRHIRNSRIHLFDVTQVSAPRPDGHPSAHTSVTTEGQVVKDCRHWCLPGIPDVWNRILLTYVCNTS